ncbi:hypothetical protein HXX76_001929 [Chlamydomonas incerta]|uniref:Uncharacterized protein n=1 Tax=Chlamydomonas incerta TaxID=51695 RepID=A0A835WA38_CHLIN|nr:hypothetical protein HXX76_001929 [Chlamydomonas incerta]|eukprot:KAG2443578.1 hypothetical protein HXX76_001929 [Chlamydomonas incerta]
MEPDATDEVLREELDPARARLRPYIEGMQRLKVWYENVPLFYNAMVQEKHPTYFTTLQLHPHTQPDARAPHALTRHALLVGETSACGRGPPRVLLRGVALPPSTDALLTDAEYDECDEYWADPRRVGGAAARVVYDAVQFAHPLGDVARLRYCPAAPHLVATKSEGGGLALLDLRPYLGAAVAGEGAAVAGAGAAASDSAAAQSAVDGGFSLSPPEHVLEILLEDEEEGDGDGDTAGAEQWQLPPPRQDEPTSELRCEDQVGVALAWGNCAAGGGGSSGGSSSSDVPQLRLFSGVKYGALAEYRVREDGGLQLVSCRKGVGHEADADIVELAWGGGGDGAAGDAAAAAAAGGGGSAELLASAGTDGRVLLWDPRQAKPVLHAPRCKADVNGVDFAPPPGAAGSAGAVGGGDGGVGSAPLLATGGDDGIVRVYDVRRLSSGRDFGRDGGGGGAHTPASAARGGSGGSGGGALYRLRGHRCKVQQLAFCPQHRGLLASSDAQGRVLLWQPGRTECLPEGLASRPELIFVHAGHLLPVDDFSWSTAMYGVVASTAHVLDSQVAAALVAEAGQRLEGQDPGVQVWRPAEDLLPRL